MTNTLSFLYEINYIYILDLIGTVVFAKEKGYNLPIKIVAIADVFIEHGSLALQRAFTGLTHIL